MKTLLKTVTLALALTLSNSMMNAQEKNIKFVDAKWEEVLKMSEKQNKPIFVDAYTTWCGPCKIMDRDVFTNKEVAGFFNKTFINVKMDMEKGEGIKLKKKWNINAFPTLLYFDKKGKVIHRIVGAYGADEFQNHRK